METLLELVNNVRNLEQELQTEERRLQTMLIAIHKNTLKEYKKQVHLVNTLSTKRNVAQRNLLDYLAEKHD